MPLPSDFVPLRGDLVPPWGKFVPLSSDFVPLWGNLVPPPYDLVPLPSDLVFPRIQSERTPNGVLLILIIICVQQIYNLFCSFFSIFPIIMI